jgi:RNA polymerase sigma-70 factor (ECF subfamily)
MQLPAARPHATTDVPADAVGADQLFRRHATYVAAFLRRLGVSDDAVDDAVQEVFLVAHMRGGYRPGPGSERTWLGAITIRVAANSRRARMRRRETLDDELLGSSVASDAPDMLVATRQELANVERALGEMSDVLRDVFVRFAVAGHSCDDIARAMGVPTGTVYSRLHAARNSFSKVCAAHVTAA